MANRFIVSCTIIIIIVFISGCIKVDDNNTISGLSVYYHAKPLPPPIINLTNFNIPIKEQENLSVEVLMTLSSSFGDKQTNITHFNRNSSTGLFEGEQGEWTSSRVPGLLYLPVNNDKGQFQLTVEVLLNNTTKTYHLFNNTNIVTVNIYIPNGVLEDIEINVKPDDDMISIYSSIPEHYSDYTLTIDTLIIQLSIDLAPDI